MSFPDAPTTGVFLARTVFDGVEDVDNVTRDRDGDWIFSGHMEVPDSIDAWVLVHLSAVAARYPQVLAVADLPRGWAAERTPSGTWDRFPLGSG